MSTRNCNFVHFFKNRIATLTKASLEIYADFLIYYYVIIFFFLLLQNIIIHVYNANFVHSPYLFSHAYIFCLRAHVGSYVTIHAFIVKLMYNFPPRVQ